MYARLHNNQCVIVIAPISPRSTEYTVNDSHKIEYMTSMSVFLSCPFI